MISGHSAAARAGAVEARSDGVAAAQAPAGVDLWFIPLRATPARLRQDAALLVESETARARRFFCAAHRRRWILARGGMRALLSRYAGVRPRELRFEYGEHGKPMLDSPRGLYFNLSHSAELAVLAVTAIGPVGVDVEQRGRYLPDRDSVAARVFSETEQHAYAALDASRRRDGFFNGWTRKEAYIKALGLGFAAALGDFDVSLTPGEPARVLGVGGVASAGAGWSLLPFQAAPDYVGAVAIRAAGECPLRRRWRCAATVGDPAPIAPPLIAEMLQSGEPR